MSNEDSIHKTALMTALRSVLTRVPHRGHCARTVFHFPKCTCDVGDRVAIAYSVVATILLDHKKGTR